MNEEEQRTLEQIRFLKIAIDGQESDPSLEEIWNEIEAFGIKRELFERGNPTYTELRDLYFLIKSKKDLTTNQN